MTPEELMIKLVEIAAIKWRIYSGDCNRTKSNKAKCTRVWCEEKLFELDGLPDVKQRLEDYRTEFKKERLTLGLPA
ncbi:hypothetical protein [Flavitalea sp.]|nr:hypothetical protein [Flavitalea sp.]